jgi:hypothetical protein
MWTQWQKEECVNFSRKEPTSSSQQSITSPNVVLWLLFSDVPGMKPGRVMTSFAEALHSFPQILHANSGTAQTISHFSFY